MKKRQFTRLISCFLLLAFALLLLPHQAYAVSQEEIDELRAKREELAQEHDEKQALVDQLEQNRASVLERKLAMDERNAITRQEIQNIEEEMRLLDQQIAEQAVLVELARADEQEQLERYRVRVRAMEESGDLHYLGLILQVNSLSELLSALVDVGDIMKSDKELYDNYIAARVRTEEVKAEYEAQKKELETRKEELQGELAELQKDIEEASRIILDLDEDIEQRNAELEVLNQTYLDTDAYIGYLIEQLDYEERMRREEEERQRQEEAQREAEEEEEYDSDDEDEYDDEDDSSDEEDSGDDEYYEEDESYEEDDGDDSGGGLTGSGWFCWPCPGCNLVTDRAGNRYHPIFDEWRYHSGLDIGASYGSSVVASDSGIVIMAWVNGGYGNCVMIDHGNGYYTLYGHLSGYAVWEGDEVYQGQTIGYVGDTGWATGPHLHFEIRWGSTCLDPEEVAGFDDLRYTDDAGE